MAEKLSYEIQIGGNQDQALGSLKKQLREATQDVQALSDKFGATSEQAIQAAKRAAELKDKIGDAKDLVAAFNPDAKFKALTGALQGVAGGFAAVQGAVGLFGKENEDLQKTLVKVQSAMAFSEGLNTVMSSIDSFKNLGAVIKNSVLTAFTSLKGAIGATGIGLLVTSIGLLVANFDKVKEAVLNLVPGLKQVGTFFSNIITKVTDFVGVTSQAERALSSLEKTTKRANEGIEARIKILTAQGGKEKEIYELSIKQGENELNSLRQRLATKGKLTEEEQKRFRELSVERQVLDAQENKRRQDNAKETSDKAKQVSDKLAEEESNRLQKQIDDEKKLTELLLAEYDKRKKDAKNAKIITQKETNQLEAQDAADKAAKQKEVDDKRINDQMKVVNTTTNYTLQGIQKQQEANKSAADNKNALDKWLMSEDKKRLDEKVSDTQSALNAISAVIDQNSVAGKAIAVAQAVINTYQGATKALGQGGVLGFVTASAVIAAGLANVKKIVSTQIPSASGTGSAGGNVTAPSLNASAPITPPEPQSQSTSLNTQTINAIGNQAMRAYVVENDVTSNQQRIAAIKQRARFG